MTTKFGDARIKGRLTFEEMRRRNEAIKKLYAEGGEHGCGLKMSEIAERYGLHERTIWRIVHDEKNQRRYGDRFNKFVKTPLDEDKCGTEAGAKAHFRRGQRPCKPCERGAARASTDRYFRRKLLAQENDVFPRYIPIGQR